MDGVANGARSRASAAAKVQQDLDLLPPPTPFNSELHGGVDPFYFAKSDDPIYL